MVATSQCRDQRGAPMRFQIGEIPVSVSGDAPQVLQDFEALYSGCRREHLSDERAISIRVGSGTASGSKPWP